MKNLFVLSLVFLSLVKTNAQSIDINKTVNDQKRQLSIDTEELKHFEEQITFFETALETGKQEEIIAAKLLIQQSMLREIKQSLNKKTSSKHNESNIIGKNETGQKAIIQNQSKQISEDEINKRRERSEIYNDAKNKQRTTSQTKSQLPKDKMIKDQSLDPITFKQQSFYEDFTSIKDTSNPFMQARLIKTLLSFYDIMEEDLNQRKKK